MPYEIEPFETLEAAEVNRVKSARLFKSINYLNGGLEFEDKDEDGIRMKVKPEFLGNEFAYDVGYVVISEYDERKFLVTKVDQENNRLWFGIWEE